MLFSHPYGLSDLVFHEEGLIDKRYEPIKTEEMSFAEIVNRSSYCLEDK